MNADVQEEAEALQAIFADDFTMHHDPATSKANKTTSFSIIVKPSPLSDGKVFCSLVITFLLPKEYPFKAAAQIEVHDVVGLPKAAVDEIVAKVRTTLLPPPFKRTFILTSLYASQLRAEKRRLTGQVQCFELCSLAREHLETHNVRPVRSSN
jgi:hypothetical protein